jgi:CRP/FNR family transcriptional regulator, cyclic AMP receptor protein
MSPDARAEKLDLTNWTNDMDWKLVRNIAVYMSSYQIPKGGILFHEHAKEAYICIILSGSVKVIKEDSDSGQKVLRRFGQGRLIGELSLVDGHPRSATVVAAKDTTVLIFTRNRLEALVYRRPKVAAQLLLKIGKDISERLRQTSGVLVDFLD